MTTVEREDEMMVWLRVGHIKDAHRKAMKMLDTAVYCEDYRLNGTRTRALSNLNGILAHIDRIAAEAHYWHDRMTNRYSSGNGNSYKRLSIDWYDQYVAIMDGIIEQRIARRSQLHRHYVDLLAFVDKHGIRGIHNLGGYPDVESITASIVMSYRFRPISDVERRQIAHWRAKGDI